MKLTSLGNTWGSVFTPYWRQTDPPGKQLPGISALGISNHLTRASGWRLMDVMEPAQAPPQRIAVRNASLAEVVVLIAQIFALRFKRRLGRHQLTNSPLVRTRFHLDRRPLLIDLPHF